MSEIIHPSEDETEFLNLGYNRFMDLFHVVMEDSFWGNDPFLRFSMIRDMLTVYSEILKYPPIQWVIDANRRPSHSDVGKDLFKFIRHVLLHFPFYEKWDDVWLKRSLVNLYSNGPQFIDSFLTRNEGREPLKYRFWEEHKKRMTYVAVTFPTDYSRGEKIFLRHMLPEKEGVKFSSIFMWDILKVQIEDISGEGHPTTPSSSPPTSGAS